MDHRPQPRPQEIYRHFKGKLYQILTLARHSETDELLVIYQALYGAFTVYARPLEQFLSPVDRVKYPDVSASYRFERVSPIGETELCSSQEVQESAVQDVRERAFEELPACRTADEGEREDPIRDEMLERFLDTDSYEERLQILTGLHHRLTDEMITIMAIACDTQVDGANLQERYVSLQQALAMHARFETSRMRG